MTTRMEHREAVVNGVRIHYVESGSGPLVLLLHGFPEFWYSWRNQIPALAAAGFRVVAPDMRGYNLSEKPAGVAPYRLPALCDDVAGLIAHCGEERATVVGHDWGGVVTFCMPVFRREVVERIAVLNAPHPGAMVRELRLPDQALRSWYIFFFQLPGLPEAALRAGDFAAIRLAARAAGPDVTEQDEWCYRDAAARPGALTAMVGYYRAAVRAAIGLRREDRQIRRRVLAARSDAPTLLIWGDADPVLGIRLTPAWTDGVRTCASRRYRAPGTGSRSRHPSG